VLGSSQCNIYADMLTILLGMKAMDNIIIRKGRTEDAQDFSQLILLSAATFFPSIFASNTEKVMRKIFQQPGNLFSFEHSYFIEVNDKIAGMALGYNWEQKRREELHTGLLLVIIGSSRLT